MELTKDTKPGARQSKVSRRNLLKGTTALTAAASVTGALGQEPIGVTSGQLLTGAPFGTVWLYVGTYTGNPSSIYGRGLGIYLCQLNLFTGKLDVLRLAAPVLPANGSIPSTASPSTIDLDPTRTHLYVGNEYGPPGAVSAYSINRRTGDLTFLNAQPTVGSPAHVSVDHRGKYLFSAEYSGSYFEVFPILANGSLGPAVFQYQTVGNVGPMKATNAPPGSFAISAHEGPNGHPHMMEADPSNQWVLGADAGQDRIYVWKLTQGASQPLTPAATPFVNTPPGDGPRHFAFHPNGVWLYSIQEEASTIMFWRFNRSTGALTAVQMISSLPAGYVGTDFTSEIRVSPNGDFVYGANRLNDTIGQFSIGTDGRLTRVSHTSTLGDYPRIFAFDPTGQFVTVGNQAADHIATFRVNRGFLRGDDTLNPGTGQGPRGSLSFTGDFTPMGSPSGMVFLF